MFAWSLDNLEGITVHTLLKSVLLTDCLTVGVTVLFSPFGALIGQACVKKVTRLIDYTDMTIGCIGIRYNDFWFRQLL
jgi:hypothetical protein